MLSSKTSRREISSSRADSLSWPEKRDTKMDTLNNILSLEVENGPKTHKMHEYEYETDNEEEQKMFEYMDAGVQARENKDISGSLYEFQRALVILEKRTKGVQTVSQEKLPLTILLHDDGGYGMLRFDQLVMKHPERGVNLFNPDWQQLAAAFAIEFITTDLAGLKNVLVNRASKKTPAIVLIKDVIYPPRSTSPRWPEAADK